MSRKGGQSARGPNRQKFRELLCEPHAVKTALRLTCRFLRTFLRRPPRTCRAWRSGGGAALPHSSRPPPHAREAVQNHVSRMRQIVSIQLPFWLNLERTVSRIEVLSSHPAAFFLNAYRKRQLFHTVFTVSAYSAPWHISRIQSFSSVRLTKNRKNGQTVSRGE